jgi:hypothetical protein
VNRWYLAALGVVAVSAAVAVWLPTSCLHDPHGCDDEQVVLRILAAVAVVAVVGLTIGGFVRNRR